MGSNTPFPLGAFVGGLSTDPTQQAAVAAQYARFTATMGAAPQFMDAFVDQGKPIAAWASDSSYTAYSWQVSGIAANTIPVIGLPMASSGDAGNQDSVFKAFASGAYDSQLQGIVSAWKDAGYATQYFRVGYEPNVPSVPWYAGTDAQTQSDYISAFQHIASVLRSVPGSDVKIVWNPNLQAGNTVVVPNLYPGDNSVDVIAGDLYNPTYPRDLYDWRLNNGTYDTSFAQWFSDPVNRTHYWQYPAANQWQQVSDGLSNTFGLQDMINFANAHGKPIGIAETGAGGDGTKAPSDDPAFPQWLASTLANSGSSVAFVNIWDTNPGDGNWDFSSPSQPKPLEASAWSKYFGAGGAPSFAAVVAATSSVAAPSGTSTGTGTVSVGSGPDQIQLVMSEDSYRGDAQFTVKVDGTQVGGTQTATASFAAGASQEFDLAGNFGGGSHNVTVQFVNDAWGGPGQDRNLYIDSIQSGGSAVQTNIGIFNNGSVTVNTGGSQSTGSGADTLVVGLSEDAWNGDAQAIVSLDGVALNGSFAVTASHALGLSQSMAFSGNFGTGPHTVSVAYVNDALAGLSQDRNLYVDSVSFDGASVPGGSAALYTNGSTNVPIPAPVATSNLLANTASSVTNGLTALLG